MSRIDEMVRQLCPDGVEYKQLGEIGTFTRGSGIQKKDFVEDGKPCIHYGQVYTYYGLSATKTKSLISEKLYAGRKKAEPGDLVIATTSENEEDVCKCVAWLGDEPCAVSGDAYIFSHDQNSKYVAYLFCSDQFQEQKKRYITGTKVLRVSGENMAKIELPFPPLDIQREIVRVLDSFAELEAKLEVELEAELEARKAQYAHYRDRLLSRESLEEMAGGEVSVLPLGELAIIGTGSHDTKDGLSEGMYTFYARGIEPLKLNEWDFDETAIVTAGDGAGVGKVFHYVEGKYALHQRAYRIVPNAAVLNPRFFFRVMRANFYDYIMKNAVQGSVASIRRRMLDKFPVLLPPLSVQQQVVDILDRFDALTTSLTDGLPAEIEARRQQYEHYRDRLLDLPRKGVAA